MARPRVLDQVHWVRASGLGALVGVLNGLLGVGGTLLVPAMVRGLRLERHDSHGTSLVVILLTSVVSLTVYVTRRGVPADLALWLSVGGLAGSFIGSRAMKRVPSDWLRRLFAAAMIGAALRMVL